ncbi:MAG: alpha/beta fold hydrolase [Gammaproteobacteria bacterium]|nr:alpha/beta fold hydrolase [Gammaproteobacteria bacterium]
MPHLTLSGGNVHYRVAGTGQPLVLLHANPGDSRDFDAISETLAQRFQVYALDWPGYGQSTLTPDQPVDVGLYARCLREFLEALAMPPAILLGNSVGGYAAARVALDVPERVRALVLVAPGGFTPHNRMTRMFCRLQASRMALSPYSFARLYLRTRSATVEAMLERARHEHAQPAARALNRALWRSFGQPDSDLRAQAERIRVPTCLMFGARDPAIPAHRDGRVARACLPQAEYHVLPSGHAPFAEIPALFLETLNPFLEGLAPASSGPQ